jgi:hypothetical protein
VGASTRYSLGKFGERWTTAISELPKGIGNLLIVSCSNRENQNAAWLIHLVGTRASFG